MKITIVGPGAFGQKHLDGIRQIDGIEVDTLIGRRLQPTQSIAERYGVPHATTDLEEALARIRTWRGRLPRDVRFVREDLHDR